MCRPTTSDERSACPPPRGRFFVGHRKLGGLPFSLQDWAEKKIPELRLRTCLRKSGPVWPDTASLRVDCGSYPTWPPKSPQRADTGATWGHAFSSGVAAGTISARTQGRNLYLPALLSHTRCMQILASTHKIKERSAGTFASLRPSTYQHPFPMPTFFSRNHIAHILLCDVQSPGRDPRLSDQVLNFFDRRRPFG